MTLLYRRDDKQSSTPYMCRYRHILVQSNVSSRYYVNDVSNEFTGRKCYSYDSQTVYSIYIAIRTHIQYTVYIAIMTHRQYTVYIAIMTHRQYTVYIAIMTHRQCTVYIAIMTHRQYSVYPNQKCMYGAALDISGYHWFYLVIFGMPLEPYYFELVIVGFRWLCMTIFNFGTLKH